MSQSTTFIVGAGASKEVNLPSGIELKKIISDLLDIRFDFHEQVSGDFSIASAFRHLAREAGEENGGIVPYLEQAWHIRDALPLAISIDNLIDSQRDNEIISLCGKLAITRAILQSERNSLLYSKSVDDEKISYFPRLEKTWYMPFFQLITENCHKDDLADRFETIALVVFNYDRCVEHFLFNALKIYYRVGDREAAEIISFLKIYHPYGSVGKLPWQGEGNGMPFGGAPNVGALLTFSQKIRTFTEGADPEEGEILEIHRQMLSATRLVFLGFAFHRLNMQLISPMLDEKNLRRAPRCFATTFGISDSSRSVIEDQLFSMYRSDPLMKMTNSKCFEFFSEYWLNLSFR